jgi:hypothetical protein
MRRSNEINDYPKPTTPLAVKRQCGGKYLLNIDYLMPKLERKPGEQGYTAVEGENIYSILPICLILATEHYGGQGTMALMRGHATWARCPLAADNPSEICPKRRISQQNIGSQPELLRAFDEGPDSTFYNNRPGYRKTLGDA